jgi:long-chain acyl-CoA synthetase
MAIETLVDLFYHSLQFDKPDQLRHKREGRWIGISSAELRTIVEELSQGLVALGVAPGDRVAILSENRPEWAFADLATLLAAAADAPVYPTLTAAQVLYVLNDSGSKVVFASTAAQVHKLAEIRSSAPQVQHVILMDEPPLAGTLSLAEVRAKGRELLARDKDAARKRGALVKPHDLATLIYTSGTTGDPKGVMLTHSNLVSNVLSGMAVFDVLSPTDVALSFLPLCHSFERAGGHYAMLYKGVTIAYAESFERLADNMVEVKPTIMLAVPRLYEKIYARVLEKVSKDPPLRQKIFRWGLGVGKRVFDHRAAGTTPSPLLALQNAVADRLVFAKIRARTGGRLRFFISGGAPLAREINEFFGSCGLLILEGYGLTETSPVISVNLPHRFRPGTVGPPLPGVEVKIAEDGEILMRGPNLMKGYYKKPEATAEVIDTDGWFHTGDIGRLDTDGFLLITDRKKDILVTSGGKNIAPQPIENRLKVDKLIAEVVMIGNKRHFPAALIVPEFSVLEGWAARQGLAFKNREELIAKPEVVALYEDLVKQATTELAPFEKIKKITLLPKEFTLDAGELTPTLKVKRRFVEQKYKELIDRMYEAAA